VDKIAKSKYFQKATENEFIKKKIEEVSNTPLLLTVEVQELAGTLAVNIPPPPTDRVWYQLSSLLHGDPRTSSLQLRGSAEEPALGLQVYLGCQQARAVLPVGLADLRLTSPGLHPGQDRIWGPRAPGP